MGLLDQILGGMAGGGKGGLGDLLGSLGQHQGNPGNTGGGGLGDLLGQVLGGGSGQQPQSGVPTQQPQSSGGLGGLGSGMNPILIAVLGMLASRAVGGMLNRGDASSSAPADGAAPGQEPAGQGAEAGGGFGGLFDQFRQGGLGSALDSWVGKGENQPINGGQLEQMLGKDAIHDLAAKLGISDADASHQMAQVLPDVVDRLTPDGQTPSAGFGDIGSMLQQLLRNSR